MLPFQIWLLYVKLYACGEQVPQSWGCWGPAPLDRGVADLWKHVNVPNLIVLCQFEHTYTHTHSVITAIFPVEPGLAGCPLNSPSPFIPGLCILLGQA